MPLQIPTAIEAAGLAVGPTTAFRWNADVYRAFTYPENAALERSYEALSPRAAYGLIAALGEWMIWRVRGRVTDAQHRDLLHRVEAAWVAADDPGRVTWTELPWDDKAKDKSAMGLIALVTLFFEEGLKDLREITAGGDEDVVFVWAVGATLASRHVWAKKRAAFAAWEKRVLPRLKKLYAGVYDPARPVVRSAFFGDPAPSAAELPALHAQFLAAVDPANPYLGKAKTKAKAKAKAKPTAPRSGRRSGAKPQRGAARSLR